MMAKNPRNYPDSLPSPESGRLMTRGEKLLSIKIEGHEFHYRQPGWWCSHDDPDDLDGQLVDDDNQVAEMARRSAKAIAEGESFPPIVIRAIRLRCGLTQREAGEVFGSGAKSFEKYESGEIRPSAPTKRLLRLAMEQPDLFRRPKDGTIRLPGLDDAGLVQETLRQVHLDHLYAPLFPSLAGTRIS